MTESIGKGVEMKKEKQNADEAVETKVDPQEMSEEAAPEEIPEVSEIDEKEKQIGELSDRLLRTQAEFENYRRRTQKEKEELASYTKAILFGQLLPILDNFERALASSEGDSFKQGVEMIHRQFAETLEKQGLAKIDTQDQIFDPQYHEAVMRESAEDVPEGMILQELQPGYKLGDQVIRPAMVKVSG